MKDLMKPVKTQKTSDEKLFQWGYGEWVEELDYKQWEYKGIECEIARNNLGSLCGYVHVPKGHSWFGKDYNEIDIDVHGGLTFSREFEDDEFVIGFDCAHYQDIIPFNLDPMRIWRKNYANLSDEMKKRIDDLDELHKKSVSLKLQYFPDIQPSYKNIAYVKAECESIVDQMLQEKSI